MRRSARPMRRDGGAPGLVLLSVNNSWNVLNFRANVVRRLQAEGFAVGVISPQDAHAGRLAELGVLHIPAAIDSKGLSPAADMRLLARYVGILRAHRPVAFLGWTVKPNVYGSIAAHMLGIPVINNVSGLGTAFIRRGPLTALVSLLYRLAFARSATVFFQNPDDRRLFVDKGLVTEGRTALLPGSGIDTTRFAPTSVSTGADDGAFIFLMIARLLRDKGVLEFVEAARIVRRDRPQARFRIVGALGAENRTAIPREELAEWVAEGVVTHLGEAEDVRPAIAAADCVVLPSSREGMPRALLEGAAMAKPLIATRVPGCIEVAREGENALLCEVRDAGSLAEAMKRMIDLPADARRTMGEAGRKIAVSEFDEAIVADRYVEALEAALAARG